MSDPERDDAAPEDRRRRLLLGAAAGAIRIGNAVGATFMNRRVLEPVEARLMVTVGVLLLTFAILFTFFLRLLVYPLTVVSVWIAVALLYGGYKLHRRKGQRE